jgi:hypothetical protein
MYVMEGGSEGGREGGRGGIEEREEGEEVEVGRSDFVGFIRLTATPAGWEWRDGWRKGRREG